MKSPICIWPHAKVRGWDGTQKGLSRDGLEFHPIASDGLAAFTEHYDSDAHAPGYVVPGESKQPRLRNSAISTLIEAGSEPSMRWVLLDIDNPDHRAWGTPLEAEITAAAVMDTHGAPNGALSKAGIYTTRAGFRLVWQLSEPMPVSRFDSWARQFIEHIEHHTRLTVDPVSAQWGRCFRLPYVVRDGERTTAYIDLTRIEPFKWTAPEHPTIRVPAPAGEALEGEIPPVSPPTPEMITAIDVPGMRRLAASIRAGKPIAAPGERDVALCSAIGKLLRHLDTTDPKVPFRYLCSSVAADTTEGAPTVEKLWGRCLEFSGRQRAELAAEKATTEAIESSPQPLILVASGARPFYVRDIAADTYRGPFSANSLCGALEEYTKPSIPGLGTRSATGKPRSAPEYIASFGKHVFEIIAELGRRKSHFDPELNGGTLIEAVAPLRTDVTPREHPQIAAWLTMLGGERADALLDWLATVTELEAPTCAIYIEGTKGVGKGLFASGVSSLWGLARTSYADVAGNFNEALGRCPVVFADESLPTDGAQFSAVLRSLVGERSRPLLRKYQPAATLIGAVRLIIGANNADALRLREQLSRDDIDAIAERILHLDADPAAAGYLASCDTAEWVARKGGGAGKIAEHLLHLRETREVERGSRFLVAGELTDFHADLTLSAGINEETLSVIAHHFDRGQSNTGIMGKGSEVWVNAGALRDRWAPLTKSLVPSGGEVAAALRTLSTGKARATTGNGRKLRFYVIPARSVLRVAERLGIGDEDALIAAMSGDVPTNPATNAP